VNEILDYFATLDLARSTLAKMSRDTGIPESTLRDWDAYRTTDKNWFPLFKGHPQARALNPEDEATNVDFPRDNYIRSGIGATQRQLRRLCLDSCAESYHDKHHLERLCVSTTFLYYFRARQGLSLRTLHKERRAGLNAGYAPFFLGRLNRLSNDCPAGNVFDLDDPCWRFFEKP
jgi:hypothetical protein